LSRSFRFLLETDSFLLGPLLPLIPLKGKKAGKPTQVLNLLIFGFFVNDKFGHFEPPAPILPRLVERQQHHLKFGICWPIKPG